MNVESSRPLQTIYPGPKLIKVTSILKSYLTVQPLFCAIWYHLYNLKNVKNTYGGVLLLVKLPNFRVRIEVRRGVHYPPSNTALTLLLWVNVLFLLKNADFLQKNADISKIKRALALKGIFSETKCSVFSFRKIKDDS